MNQDFDIIVGAAGFYTIIVENPKLKVTILERAGFTKFRLVHVYPRLF
jgi:hypothetical protein